MNVQQGECELSWTSWYSTCLSSARVSGVCVSGALPLKPHLQTHLSASLSLMQGGIWGRELRASVFASVAWGVRDAMRISTNIAEMPSRTRSSKTSNKGMFLSVISICHGGPRWPFSGLPSAPSTITQGWTSFSFCPVRFFCFLFF